MTKVDIFSGFLGAGKTTLIKKLIKEAYRGEMIVVIENEFGYYYNDCTSADLSGHYMDRLRELPNVILMHHMGFYYETAIRDMVVNSLKAMKAVEDGSEIPLRLV